LTIPFDDIVYGVTRSYFTDIRVDYGSATTRASQRIVNRGFGRLPLQLITKDVDGNGHIDVAYRTTRGVSFALNNGGRDYDLILSRLGESGPNLLGEYFKLFDANDDGLIDIVWSGTDRLQVFLKNSGQGFATPIDLARPPSAGGALRVHVADTDADGHNDIILSSGGEIYVYKSVGDGSFQPFEAGYVTYPISTMKIADINGDGSLDLISGQRFSVTVHFSKPSATGQFKSGAGEFSTLTKLPDGTWQRRYKDGNVVEFNADGLQTAEVDPHGNRREFAYGADRRLLTITDQVGGVTQFTYEALGRLASITYPDGRETLFTYDDQKLAQITEPTGGTVSFAYDANNRLISTTNQNGNTSDYSYDATGKMNGADLPDGSSIKNQIAASLGLVDGLGGPAPSPRIYVAPEDRVTTVTDRKGETTEIVVNQFGAIVKTTDPLGRVTLIERDDGNLATRIERPGVAPGTTRIDTLEYDAVANVRQRTEAVGTPQERTTQYEYEPTHSKLTRMVEPGGVETLYTVSSS